MKRSGVCCDRSDMRQAAGLRWSDPSAAMEGPTLVSPPPRWPECFQDAAMKRFVGKKHGLACSRCRLVTQREEQDSGDEDDDMAVAMRARAEHGWRIVGGFAIYGVASKPGLYVARRRWWNAKPDGGWVDLTATTDAVSYTHLTLPTILRV